MENKAIEQLQSDLARLQDQVNDQGRQTSKDCIVIEGTAVKVLDKELPKDTLIRTVRLGWGLILEEEGIKQVKITLKRSGKNRMLAKFNQCWEGSIFHRIITNRPDASEHLPGTLFRHLHLTTPNDHTMDFVARNMKRTGELKSFIWHYVSGRLKVTFPDGKRKTFSTARALRSECSERLLGELKAKDRERRSQQGGEPEAMQL